MMCLTTIDLLPFLRYNISLQCPWNHLPVHGTICQHKVSHVEGSSGYNMFGFIYSHYNFPRWATPSKDIKWYILWRILPCMMIQTETHQEASHVSLRSRWNAAIRSPIWKTLAICVAQRRIEPAITDLWLHCVRYNQNILYCFLYLHALTIYSRCTLDWCNYFTYHFSERTTPFSHANKYA